MLNQAQEAYDLTGGAFATGAAPDRADRRRRAPLVVVEGGHLDADARRGVAPEFWRRVRLVVCAIRVVFAVGCVRVALTVGTVNLMQGNAALEKSIGEAEATNTDLQVERSLLSSKDRIRRIATQNLGMVYSTEDEALS